MELRQIEYVLAVARYNGFTRAAEALHVAQPALSSAILRLEHEIGVRLFERTSRRVELTDAGKAFLARARRVTSEVGLLSEEMVEFAGGTRGHLRISTWYQVDPEIADILHGFTVANPNVELSIVEWSSPRALEGLRDGEIDTADIVLTDGLDLAGLDHAVLRSQPLELVTPPAHPLANRESVRPGDIARERFIVPQPGTGLRHCFDRAFALVEPPPRIAIETNQLAAIMAYVSVGLGLAILPPSIAERVDVPAKRVPIAGVAPFVLAVAWRRNERNDIVRRAIEAHLRRGRQVKLAVTPRQPRAERA